MVTAAATVRTREPTATTRLVGLFCALFAVSLILHQIWWSGFEVTTPHAAVVLVAMWALLRPTSVGRFAVMIGAEVGALALDMPFVGSHTLLVLIVGGCVLAQIGVMTVRGRGVPSAVAVLDAVAPFLRVSLILVYATAALAKLNSGFLDPALSCAASMSRQVAWFDPTLLDGDWRVGPAIWGTLLIEVSLPILLAVRRTRLIGVVLGGGFHVVLALAGNVPFTALAFAFYVVFLPIDTLDRLPRAPSATPAVRAVALVVMVGAWLAASAADPALLAVIRDDGARLVIVVIALAGAAVLVATRRGAPDPPAYPARSLRVTPPILLAGVLVLVVNGASPYLGLKTDASFEMFSNLRTEPGAWNHLVVPEAVRIFGYQDRPVHVLAATDPALLARAGPGAGAGADRGTRMTGFELDRYLRTHPGTTATVDGRPTTVGPLAGPPTPAEWIAVFRDVPAPGTPRC